MTSIKYIILACVTMLFCNCSESENGGESGSLPGSSLLSFSILHNGSYYDATQESETAWHVSLPVTATDTAYHARCELAKGVTIVPNPNLLLSYPQTFTLSDEAGNSLEVTVSMDNNHPYYGIWLTANGKNYYPTAQPNQEQLIILPAEAAQATVDYLLPEGSTISPTPDLTDWPEDTSKEFTITDAQGNSSTTTYRWVRNNYFTMIVFGDPEYDMREFTLANGEIKNYIDKIIALKDDASRYFEPSEGLRIDYGPEIVLCVGDIDDDANSDADDFMSVFGALYDNGIPFVTVYGNHDWSTYNWWFSDDNGFTLTLDKTDYGFTRGEEANNERTLALIDRTLEESKELGVTLERKFLSTDYGHNYEGEVAPFVFTFRSVRFYCGQTYWFQQWYTPTLLPISGPATFHCTDEIMEELERKIDEGWGEAPAVWIQHYPMSNTDVDGGSAMWWHNRQGFGPEADDPDANQSVKWPTFEDKVAQMKKIIGKTKNPIFFAGHTHVAARHEHTAPAFYEYVTPYFHNGGVYVVLMREGEGVVEVKQISL